jgi:Family of unknown function (DUF5641)
MGKIKEQNVVILEEEKLKRYDWPIRVVKQVFLGRDEIGRVTVVKTKTGLQKRVISKLICMPIRD